MRPRNHDLLHLPGWLVILCGLCISAGVGSLRLSAVMGASSATGTDQESTSPVDRETGPAENPQGEQIDLSINRALSWLAAEQLPSGAWKAEDYGESTAMTSLAVLAFLAGGHVPDEGPYGRQISRGVAWVLGQQSDKGMLSGRDTSHGPMYSHGITTLMLAEVSGMLSGDSAARCRTCLEKAVRLIIDAQNHPKPLAHQGGWRYQPTSEDADLSVTAWQLLALRAAKDIGCDVPSENIDRAVTYLRSLAVASEGGFGYMAGHGSTVTRAGTGIVALEVCGEHRTEEIMAAARMIQTRSLTDHEAYFYYGAYYCTVGMYKVGGDEWLNTRSQLYDVILRRQDPAGYWPTGPSSERRAGVVYSTALSVLGLSIEYGYLPIYQR